MLTNLKVYLFPFFLVFIASPSYAGLIAINGYQFYDKINTTIDLQTRLEWLDLTETAGISYKDMVQDLAADGGRFDIADGWRYATRADLLTLFSATLYPGLTWTYRQYLPGQEQDVANFIRLFGDMHPLDPYPCLGAQCPYINPYKSAAAGYTKGWYFDEYYDYERDPAVFYAGVYDDDYLWSYTNPPVLDRSIVDDLSDLVGLSIIGEWDLSTELLVHSAPYGSWLVRDFVVSEPSPLFLLGLSLFSCVCIRRYKLRPQ